MKKLLTKLEPVGAAVSVAPPAESTNSLIGKSYKLEKGTVVVVEEVLAEGGFGIVFLVRNSNNLILALKRIVVNNEDDLNSANREVAIMSTLGASSSFILPCLDSLTQKLSPDVTEVLSLSPFCKSNLLTLLQKSQANKTPLKEEHVLRITADICQAVARLHHCTTPVIHRDLKIENILIQSEGGVDRYVLCDFGSATGKFWDPEVHSVAAISEDLEKYTTLAYRSPEMVDLYSKRGPITTKADIWALGVAIYKLLYYTTPFGESILSIQSSKLEFPSSPSYSSRIQSLISYMLLGDQNLRPDIYQVSELVHRILDTKNPVTNLNKTVPWSFEEIDAFRKKSVVVQQQQNNKVSVPAVVVLETSVTPRQRPKAGTAQVTTTTTATTAPAQIPIETIMPPPKSPKVERKQNSDMKEETSPVPGEVNSWNPFASCNSIAPAPSVSPTSSADDPFAHAPFDYFKYQPIMIHSSEDMFGAEPFSNPFLHFNNSNLESKE